jgi:LacI family transcriptional regulator
VDGLVLMSPEFTGELSRRTLPAGFPVVLLNSAPAQLPHASLTIANFEGARAMVRHLAGLGHRRIALIRGAEGNFSEAAGVVGARALLELPIPPTAIFAANDGMAIGALFALRDAGRRVPEDIAIGGFDDIPMARYVEPSLTTVHVDISALGERAATRLLALLEGRSEPDVSRETQPTTLVVRRSCGAPSS